MITTIGNVHQLSYNFFFQINLHIKQVKIVRKHHRVYTLSHTIQGAYTTIFSKFLKRYTDTLSRKMSGNHHIVELDAL